VRLRDGAILKSFSPVILTRAQPAKTPRTIFSDVLTMQDRAFQHFKFCDHRRGALPRRRFSISHFSISTVLTPTLETA
jgi:hypothetical protein